MSGGRREALWTVRCSLTVAALVLVGLLAVPVAALGAPTTTPRTGPEAIVSEGFEATSATYLLSPVSSFPYGTFYWGRRAASGYGGGTGLWCSATAGTTWPLYNEFSAGYAVFYLPDATDFYEISSSFQYRMPSLGAADSDSFAFKWIAEEGGSSPAIKQGLAEFPKTSSWSSKAYTLTDPALETMGMADGNISRRAGHATFFWIDAEEAYNVTPRVGEGPTVDNVDISGWRYGPVRSLGRTASPTSVSLSWSRPLRSLRKADVDGSVPEERTIGYAVWRAPQGTSDWTLLTPSAITQANYTDNTAALPGGSYTYLVQPWDAADHWGKTQTVNASTGSLPTAVADAFSTAEDTPLTKTAGTGVLVNDTDPGVPSETLTAALVTGVSHGSLSLASNGSFTYTPAANYHGVDSFTYRAYDGYTYSNTVTVSLTVTSVNDVPVGVADSYTALRSSTLSIATPGVLSNDTDADGDPLTAQKLSDPSHGSPSLASNGSFTYTPTTNYVGPDSFTYRATDGTANSGTVTVSLNVADSNTAPVASDDTHTFAEDTPLVLNPAAGVLSNDADAENDTMTAILLVGPSHGALALSPDGSFTYSPDANYHGPDSFTYKAYDGREYSNVATVSLTVTAVNDVPVAGADSYSTAEDIPIVRNAAEGLLANDTDVEGGPLSAVKVTGPSHGTLALSADGSFTYTPAANYHGPDSFTYKANDGTADSNTVTVPLDVTSVQDTPVAAGDSYTTAEDTALIVNAPSGPLANDVDYDGDELTAVLSTPPGHGTLGIGPDGAFLYSPDANYNGSDSFTYRAYDGIDYSNTVAVSITITSVNDAPVAVPDGYELLQDEVLVIEPDAGVLSNDSDAEGDPLTAVLVGDASHGYVDLLDDGSFAYVPDAGWSGTDSFTYVASDQDDDSNVTTVEINVTPKAVYVPVYRFYNVRTGVHFYTASEAEKNNVINNLSAIYKYEGIAYRINIMNPDNKWPLYRFYNLKMGVHFYTASETEKNNVINTLSATYKYEGVAYKVSKTPTNGAPIYRFYNLKKGVHFYTASETEKNNVINTLSATYKYEGVGYYIGN